MKKLSNVEFALLFDRNKEMMQNLVSWNDN